VIDMSRFEWTASLLKLRREMGAPAVAGVINTLNEELNLPDALRSLGWVDQIIVVDMHSDDQTRAIAESFGARVELFERSGVVEPARNFAIEQAAEFDWVMLLDADERVPQRLAEQLVTLSLDDTVGCVEVPYANHLLGARLAASGWGGEYHPRFFRSGSLDWPTQVHGNPARGFEAHGRVIHLRREHANEVEHQNIRDLVHFTEKTNRYTDHEPKAETDTPGWRAAAASARAEVPIRWSPRVDGTRSVALTGAMVFYRLLSHAKAWEARGYERVDVPGDGGAALRQLGSDAVDLRAQALERLDVEDVPAAYQLMRHAVASAVGPDLLSDLAVVAHERGDAEGAEALLRACLVLDPSHGDARENLAAIRVPAA
jgi:hypothetical protein